MKYLFATPGEIIRAGDVEVIIVAVHLGRVRLGVKAPDGCAVTRERLNYTDKERPDEQPSSC